MANETLTSSIAALIPEITAEAQYVVEENSIMAGLVKTATLPYSSGKTVEFPTYTAVDAADYAETADITANEEVVTTSETITVIEAGLMSTISDMAQDTSSENIIATVGQLHGMAMARQLDKKLLALFSGFGTSVGNGVVNMTAALWFEALTRLAASNADTAGISCVLHPYILHDLTAEITSSYVGDSDAANAAMTAGFVGNLGGINIFRSSNIVDALGVSSGAIFHRDALGLATLRPVRMETERDASFRRTEIVSTAVYGVGELNDAYGVHLDFNSSLNIV